MEKQKAGAFPQPGPDGSRLMSILVFDTEVRLYAYPSVNEGGAGGCADRLDAALIACCDRCEYFERIFSRTRPDSDISRAHTSSPGGVYVAEETAELVELSRAYCERSGGLFDITMGTVTSLWDFRNGAVPSRLALARALPHIDYRRVRIERAAEGPLLALDDPDAVLDLGGIAKGYIADDLASLLVRAGVTRFALNLGGNVLVRGGRPDSLNGVLPWRVGVVDPFAPSRHRAIIEVCDGSVVTSGVHERRFSRGGKTYHHILDPRTGMPAVTDVASATVVASRSIECDGLSTTLFMMGARDAVEFASSCEGVDALVIDECGRVMWTPGLDGKVHV